MEAAEVGSVTPEQLERQVERLARDFLTQSAVPVVAELGYLRDQTFGLLEGHRYPHQWADLNVIAAKLCGLLATASSDRFGCYDAAAHHLRTAWLCADKAGHSELKAWVLGIRSTVDFWLGNYQQAADRASEGHQYVSRGTELVRLGSLEARARGSLGDRNGVQEAVQLAASARETLDDADEARHIGIFAFPIANQVRCAGNAHMWLSDPRSIETARHELEEALRLFEAGIPHQSYAHIAVTRVDLTIVDLRLGQLDTAAATMQPVLELPTDRRLAGVVRRSGELRRQLANSGKPSRASAPPALPVSSPVDGELTPASLRGAARRDLLGDHRIRAGWRHDQSPRYSACAGPAGDRHHGPGLLADGARRGHALPEARPALLGLFAPHAARQDLG
jgi:hypothetical protein